MVDIFQDPKPRRAPNLYPMFSPCMQYTPKVNLQSSRSKRLTTNNEVEQL